MTSRARFAVLMQPVDVGVQLCSVDAPHATPSDLHCREITRSNKGIDLRHAHVEVRGDVLQSKQAWLDARSPASFLRFLHDRWHDLRITLSSHCFLALSPFSDVWTTEDPRE